jgi:endonuclease
MRLIIADCSAIYSGRGDTQLGRAVRAVIIKEDGSVSIHNDVGNKPLNYMKCAPLTETFEDGLMIWTFDARHESLRIVMHEVISDVSAPLVVADEGLVRDGTEPQLQAWLADNVEVLGQGYTLVQREYPTGNGPVDLLVQDREGRYIAVEVKRVAMLGAVDQVRRYVDALKTTPGFEDTRGIIAALDIRPKTQIFADKKKMETVLIPQDWRRTSKPVERAVTEESA